MSFFLNQSKSAKYLGFAAFLLLALLEQVNAQSGRRASKPPSASNPVSSPVTNSETSEAETEKTVPAGDLQQKVQLLIARQPTRKHLPSEDAILASCIKRLNQYSNVSGTSLGDLKHHQAVRRAKAETESRVVLLSFEIDSFQGGTIILNSPDLVIEYLVLAPGTGKKETKGKVYFQAIGGGRMRRSDWPNGSPIKITPEAAGIEAAEHVYDCLRLAEIRKRRTHD
jgi:hypothetical protein